MTAGSLFFMGSLLKNFKTVIFITTLLLIVSSIGCTKEERTSRLQVVDSEAWTYLEGIEKTFWVDNERVLFVSNRNLSPTGGNSTITVWTPSTGQISFSHETQSLICTEGEQVFFVAKDKTTDAVKFYRGPMEAPEEHPQPEAGMRLDKLYDCDWAPAFSRAKVPYLIKLREGNYLEVLKDETFSAQLSVLHGEVNYYERLDLPPTSLPIYADMAGDYAIKFNKRVDAYFISPSQFFPEDPYYHSVWWLQRNGDLRKEPFPKNTTWTSRGGLDIHPLKDGYLALYQGGGTRSMRDTGDRGLYLMRGGSVETVITGAIHAVSVSPDGCNAAFIHAKNTEEYLSHKKPHRTVKAINFCIQ